MAIYSDMNGFPESGMPALKNTQGRAKADSLVVTDAISIVAGDKNNLGSVGKNNVFTNGAAGSNGFMAGYNNIVTLTAGQTKAVAIGVDCAASGNNGNAIGVGNSGTGTNIGRSNTSTGVGIGLNCSGSGISIGSGAAATNSSAYAIGSGNATNTFANAIGNFVTASGIGASAIGFFCTASTDSSVAIGGSCTANTGANSTAMGSSCTASGANALAFGFGATATAANAGIFGHAPLSFTVTNSTANSLMLAYEGTNFLMTATAITANTAVNITSSLQCDAIVNDTGLAHGTYTPTLTGVANVSSSTPRLATYMRVGNTVTVAGQMDITPTANNIRTRVGISLPVASNFSTAYQAGGTAATIPNSAAMAHNGGIIADATNDRVELDYYETNGTIDTFSYTFTYQVI
jgi:hypothetical protein